MKTRLTAGAAGFALAAVALTGCGSSQTQEEACAILQTDSQTAFDKVDELEASWDGDQTNPDDVAKLMTEFNDVLHGMTTGVKNSDVKKAIDDYLRVDATMKDNMVAGIKAEADGNEAELQKASEKQDADYLELEVTLKALMDVCPELG